MLSHATCDHLGPGACPCARASRLDGAFTGAESVSASVEWRETSPGRRWEATYSRGWLVVEWLPDDERFVLCEEPTGERLACAMSFDVVARAADLHDQRPALDRLSSRYVGQDSAPTDPLRRAREFIEASQWTFAKTMPEIPHEYTVRGRTAAPDVDFDWMVRQIRAEGFEAAFHERTYMYWRVDDHKYWTMGAPVDETTIINRSKGDS